MTFTRIAVVGLVAVACGSTALAQSGTEHQSRSNPTEGRAARDAAVAAWTPDRLRAAAVVALPDVDPSGISGIELEPAEPGIVESAAIERRGDRPTRAAGNVFREPLSWAGRLFYSDAGDDFVCSAQFISPNVILTAAHCVRDPDTGRWFDDFVFGLQYLDGEAEEWFGYDCVATQSGWVEFGEDRWPFDYATILIEGSSPTGHFGTHWDWQGEYFEAIKIGYPSGVDDGRVIQVEEGPILIEAGIVELQHNNPAAQQGSSGGAWIGDFQQGNHIISVESFGYEGLPGISFGPYLTADFRELWLYTENGCN